MSAPGPIKKRLIHWIWNNTMTCKEVTRLASQRLDQPLPLVTRARLWLHTRICEWCGRYLEQVKLIHDHAPQYGEKAGEVSPRMLSPDAKERMKKALQDDSST
jgi:hypothetical protein